MNSNSSPSNDIDIKQSSVLVHIPIDGDVVDLKKIETYTATNATTFQFANSENITINGNILKPKSETSGGKSSNKKTGKKTSKKGGRRRGKTRKSK